MEISKTNVGAAAYAMKKAMAMPNLMLSLLEANSDLGKQSLGATGPVTTQTLDLLEISGKGKIIDLVA